MALTRPSGLSVLRDPSAPVIQEVTQIDGRGRLNLLPRWTSRISWWNAVSKNDPAILMVLVEPGLLSLRDWETEEPRIGARYAELLAVGDAAAFEAVRLMQDRYGKLPIDSEHRVHIGDSALAHLGFPLDRGIKSTVYVAVFPDKLDLFSPAYRNARLIVGSPYIDDLP